MKLKLCIFIDAFGWEILQSHPYFLSDLAVEKKKLRTILGYSSACDPSIISGLKPSQHGLWSSYYYSPATSPFKWEIYLQYLPKKIINKQRVRGVLSRWIKKIEGFTGYFQLYQLPFEHLHYFDYAEKQRIWSPGGLGKEKTIFDHLTAKEVPYYVGDEEGSDQKQLDKVKSLIESNSIQFAYLLLGQLDALMHAVGTHDHKVNRLVQWYDQQLKELIKTAEKHYEQVEWYIFSDHGMHDVVQTYDLQSKIDQLGLSYGKDFVAMYDSTMARFWYMHDEARQKIEARLNSLHVGRLLPDAKLIEEGVFFFDRRYGESVFLMNSGILIIPSFMGLNPIPGMHGYDPEDPSSYAMICSNRPLPSTLDSIEKIYDLF